MTEETAKRKDKVTTMLVVMKKSASTGQINRVHDELARTAEYVDVLAGTDRTILGHRGDESVLDIDHLRALPGVDEVLPVMVPYRRVMSLDPGQHRIVVNIGGVEIGNGNFAVIGGPCAAENPDQALEAARRAKAAGAHILRGEGDKPRKDPDAFEGLGLAGWRMMREVADEVGLPYVAEVMEIADIERAFPYVDGFRVGAQNMMHFRLLNALGRQPKPVIIKRGPHALHQEWFLAAERVAKHGNPNIILCARGIRTFEDYLRFTPDIASIGVAHDCTRLPVIYDPSHSGGRSELVRRICRAAMGMGADGLIVDMHPNPPAALVDGAQALTPDEFDDVMLDVNTLAPVFGLKL